MNCDMKSIMDFTEKMQNRREDYRKCKQICKNFPHESHHKPKEGILSWQPPGAVHTRHSSADHCGLWSWGSTACSPGLAKLQWQKRPQRVNDLRQQPEYLKISQQQMCLRSWALPWQREGITASILLQCSYGFSSRCSCSLLVHAELAKLAWGQS